MQDSWLDLAEAVEEVEVEAEAEAAAAKVL